ncbi:hypothetical protein [Oceanicaulis sp. HTCC2633]|uniref:DUF6950 family protein n=1 Tax=Oceanicaulis sp. HTCC2633 TaxID=314254 RepID=UPI0012EAF45A|nr:hypothetical protein [Oceanicaulis sp. HTCC2633]
MSADLARWLDHAAGARFANCAAFAADWVEMATGAHPAPWVRELPEQGWRAALAQRGGMRRVMADVAAGCGARVVACAKARPGDVGLVLTRDQDGRRNRVCAVRAPAGGWALWMGRDGLVITHVEALKVWRVVHG